MAAEEGALSVIIDKVSFLKQVPWLLKATSDDENPTPGYMYQQICDISMASGSYCQTLLDYFLDRLDKDSCQVKLKVLRIMHNVVQNGHPDFRQGLRRRSRGLQEASKYSGPPDPLHGNAQYMAVRTAAQNLSQLLFDVSMDDSKVPQPQATYVKPQGGMGTSFQGTKMQGFGNVPNKPTKTIGETIMTGLKGFADYVADPTDPRWAAAQASADPFKQGDYRPVVMPVSAATGVATQQQPEWEKPVVVSHRKAVTPVQQTQRQARTVTEHRPGVAGGGWEDDPLDSDQQPNTKSHSSTTLRSPSDKHSNDSLNGSSYDHTPVLDEAEITERLEDVRIEDWREEEQLVDELVVDCERLIPPRDKVNNFLKKCGERNSEMIIIFLNRYLQPNNEQQAFRALLLIDYLMRSEHVTIDHITYTCSTQLVALYKRARGTTKAKARKVIRQLQLLSGQIDLFSGMPPMPRFAASAGTTFMDHANRNMGDTLDNQRHAPLIQSLSAPVDLNRNANMNVSSTPTPNSMTDLSLPVEPFSSARPLNRPDGRSSDSSPEWSSLQIPFAGSLYNTVNSISGEVFTGPASCSDIPAAFDEVHYERHKDSSMSEDSLKGDDSAFDFLNE